MFKALGILVCFYTAHAAASGQVYAKSGAWGRMVLRQNSPEYFWVVIFIYACLGIALITVF
jgi:hypothetical protein